MDDDNLHHNGTGGHGTGTGVKLRTVETQVVTQELTKTKREFLYFDENRQRK